MTGPEALGGMTVAGVAAGAAAGAVLRYGTERLQARVRRRRGRRSAAGAAPGPAARPFPWATLAVNVVGSALLGAVAARAPHLDRTAAVLLGAGLAGGLTTFSTFAVDVVELLRERRRRTAATYAVATLLLGTAAAAAAFRTLA